MGVGRLVGYERRGAKEPSARELGVEGAGEVVVLEATILDVVAYVVVRAAEAAPALGLLLELTGLFGRDGRLVGEDGDDEFAGHEGAQDALDHLLVRGLGDVALEGDVGEVRLGRYVDGHVAALCAEGIDIELISFSTIGWKQAFWTRVSEKRNTIILLHIVAQ